MKPKELVSKKPAWGSFRSEREAECRMSYSGPTQQAWVKKEEGRVPGKKCMRNSNHTVKCPYHD